MMRKNLLTSIVILLISITTTAQEYDHNAFEKMIADEHTHLDGNLSLRDVNSIYTENYDLRYCKMEWTIDPAVRYINGVVQLDFIPLTANFNTINFDLHASMTVNSVTFNGNTLTFSQDAVNNLLVITLPSILPVGVMESIIVDYQGNPPNTGFGAFESTTVCNGNGNYDAMWTLSEPYGAKDWWPCKQDLNDKIESIDVYVTCNSQYRAASNGLLVSEVITGANTTYHWQHQHAIPAYLIAIAVSEYDVYSDFVPLTGGGNVEVLNYTYPCNTAYAQTRTPYTIGVMQLFNTMYIEYPFADEKYGHINFGWGGGMEHTTGSFMGGFSNLLISHELAHQWFGDYITCGSWEDIWLNEGFATYSEGMTYENGLGTTTWANWKAGKINHVTQTTSGSVWVDDTTSVGRIFNGRLSYSKGALLLHMLRWKLGDTDFFQAVQNYLNDMSLAHGYAKTADLKAHLEAVSGQNLTPFFAQWFYGQGWPTYTVQWAQHPNNEVVVQLNQIQSHASVPYFTMPVPIEFSDGMQSQIVTFDHLTEGQYFTVTLPFAATTATFDPEKWLCAKSNVSQNNTLLPLDLINFEVKLLNHKEVELIWQTENEIQVAGFDIERSFDGVHFEKIGQVEAQQDVLSKKNYAYTDIVKNLTNELLYYRLKMNDEDGQFSYSFIKTVTLAHSPSLAFKIYPNPNTGVFTLAFEGKRNEIIDVLIYNTLGQLVYTRTIPLTQQNKIELNVNDLPTGVYQITIGKDGQQATQTLYIE